MVRSGFLPIFRTYLYPNIGNPKNWPLISANGRPQLIRELKNFFLDGGILNFYLSFFSKIRYNSVCRVGKKPDKCQTMGESGWVLPLSLLYLYQISDFG